MLVINTIKTGQLIKKKMKESRITAKDIQKACQLEGVQAVYKWRRGDCLPSLDSFVNLCQLMGTSIEDILVVEERP